MINSYISLFLILILFPLYILRYNIFKIYMGTINTKTKQQANNQSNLTSITPELSRDPKIKTKKDYISPELKKQVWETYFYKLVSVICPCCHKYPIYHNNFEAGHIIAEAFGGKTCVENLKPVCSMCNKSMQTVNYDDFHKMIVGKIVIDVSNLRKIFEIKIWDAYYKHNQSGKCICCLNQQIDNFKCNYCLYDNTKPSYITNIIPVCAKCFKLSKTNNLIDTMNFKVKCYKSCCFLL
jgi:hypothetical protein